MKKLHEYQGTVGRLHEIKNGMAEKYAAFKERGGFSFDLKSRKPPTTEGAAENVSEDDFAHIFRTKTRRELVRISAAVMGIEFSYAAETAFVSPTLLEIGVQHSKMTMVWCLSPLVGFLLTPILGSLSDKCTLAFGRRRPFIILLSVGIVLGLILVPNGRSLGIALGDRYSSYNGTLVHETSTGPQAEPDESHPWGVFFTVLGTVLLDFDADACQSPSRAYLLDVTVPDDHARGLSTFTIMAGLGGFMGYAMGGINWDETFVREIFGGHVRAVFTLITVIFIVCVSATVTSFREIPLKTLDKVEALAMDKIKGNAGKATDEREPLGSSAGSYGTVQSQGKLDNREETIRKIDSSVVSAEDHSENPSVGDNGLRSDPKNEGTQTLLQYHLQSLIYMPPSLRVLCLTNLFSWMAHVCYSLYFTDYVGESVYGGNPKAPEGSLERTLYQDGVRFGCWGMSMYSLSCSCYSMIIEKLIQKYKAKKVYVGGLLFFSGGMLFMVIFNNQFGVILFSWAAGVMYSTLFTMPFLLVATYHSQNLFALEGSATSNPRGLGTDVAIVSSMVFLAQFSLSLCVGSLISWTGSTKVVVLASAFLSFCGSLSATQVAYFDL